MVEAAEVEAAEVVRAGHRQYLSDDKQVVQVQRTPGQVHYLQGIRPTEVAEGEVEEAGVAEVRRSFYDMHLIHRPMSDHIHSQSHTSPDSLHLPCHHIGTCLPQGRIRSPAAHTQYLEEEADILLRQEQLTHPDI